MQTEVATDNAKFWPLQQIDGKQRGGLRQLAAYECDTDEDSRGNLDCRRPCHLTVPQAINAANEKAKGQRAEQRTLQVKTVSRSASPGQRAQRDTQTKNSHWNIHGEQPGPRREG